MSTTASNISISTPNQENGYQNDNINITNNIGNLPAIDLNTSNIYSPGTSAININAFNGGVQITSNTGGIALYEYSNGGIVIAESGGGIYIAENGGGIEIVDQDAGNVSIDSSSGFIGIGNADNDSYYDGFIETTTINIGNTGSTTTFFGDVDFTGVTVKGLSGGSGFSGDYNGDITLNATGSGKTTIGNNDNGGDVNVKSKNDINIIGNGIITMKSTAGGGININTSGTDAVNIGNTGVTTTFKGTVDFSNAIIANSFVTPQHSLILAPTEYGELNMTNSHSGQTYLIDCTNLPDTIYRVTIPLTPGFSCTLLFGGGNGFGNFSSWSGLIYVTAVSVPGPYANSPPSVFNGTLIYQSTPTYVDNAYCVGFSQISSRGDYLTFNVLSSGYIFVRGSSLLSHNGVFLIQS